MRKILFSAAAIGLGALLACSACAGSDPYDVTLAEFSEASIHTAAQTKLLTEDLENLGAGLDGMSEKSLPTCVHFAWDAFATAENAPAIAHYILEIEAEGDVDDERTYTTEETSFDVYNLCVAADYEWRVTAVLENGAKCVSETSRFHTEDAAPRNLFVEGVTNVRDLGGWETPLGRVRQGAIIRCGRLNESETAEVNIEITPNGIQTMLNDLGVRTEIDLRDPANKNETGGITSSPLGESVLYVNIPLQWNVSNLLTGNLAAVRTFFSFVSNESNYPIIYHCNIGTDRTGLFAFLINGLLGVSEEDLYRDYAFSNLGKINGFRSIDGIRSSYVATVKSYPGATLSERIERCLIDLVGVPQEQIDNLKYNLSA